MTVEELREMEWRADEHADFSGYKIHAVAEEAFDELARRLEEVQQKIVAQQAVVSNALEAISATHFFDDPKSRMQRARAVLQSDDLSALAAHDAELTAKAKAEALEEARAGIDTIDDGEQPAYRHCQEFLGEKAAEYRAKAGRKE